MIIFSLDYIIFLYQRLSLIWFDQLNLGTNNFFLVKNEYEILVYLKFRFKCKSKIFNSLRHDFWKYKNGIYISNFKYKSWNCKLNTEISL